MSSVPPGRNQLGAVNQTLRVWLISHVAQRPTSLFPNSNTGDPPPDNAVTRPQCSMTISLTNRFMTPAPAILKGLNHLAQGCPESSRGYPGSNPIKAIYAESVASQHHNSLDDTVIFPAAMPNSCRQRRKLPQRRRSNRRALPITMMSENPMAAAQNTGLTKPNAASGTPNAL